MIVWDSKKKHINSIVSFVICIKINLNSIATINGTHLIDHAYVILYTIAPLYALKLISKQSIFNDMDRWCIRLILIDEAFKICTNRMNSEEIANPRIFLSSFLLFVGAMSTKSKYEKWKLRKKTIKLNTYFTHDVQSNSSTRCMFVVSLELFAWMKKIVNNFIFSHSIKMSESNSVVLWTKSYNYRNTLHISESVIKMPTTNPNQNPIKSKRIEFGTILSSWQIWIGFKFDRMLHFSTKIGEKCAIKDDRWECHEFHIDRKKRWRSIIELHQ